MPAGALLPRRDLVRWMIGLRRVAVLVGFGAVLLERLVSGAGPSLDAIVLVVLGVCAYNEGGRYLLDWTEGGSGTAVANTQIALDTGALITLLHFGGGLTSQGLLFFAAPFFVYGAVLPLADAFCHVGITMLALTVLALAERNGVLAHYAGSFFAPDTHARSDFLTLRIVLVSVVNSLCVVMSHHLSVLLRARAEDGRALAAERGVLLANYEREATRVRLLLDIAQRASATPTVREVLGAVCDATVAMGCATRVETFVWDADQGCLRLVGARGLSSEGLDEDDVRYSGELPIVARLRAGEVVDFDAVPSLAMSATRVDGRVQRAFAAPMMCAGAFEGALVVGYEDEAKRAELTEVVHGIACQAALAVANVRALEEQHEDAEVSGILLQVSQALSACLDTADLWQRVIRSASEVLEVPWAVGARFDERDGTFSLVGAHGLPEPVLRSFADARFKLDDSPVLRELLSRREVVVADESRVQELVAPAGWQVGAWLVIPLLRGGWVAGLLAAGYFSRRRSFGRRQLRLAEGLGHHASIALQNARLVADLEAADRLKSEFVSTMSHELRTPLNVIIGYTEMLRDGAAGQLTEEQLELVHRLDARGRELLELVEATLHVGRLEAGRDPVEIAPVVFSDLLRALQASTTGLPRPAGVTLEWEAPSDGRERIMTDRSKLALVVRNLVSNALKFTPEGKVVVRVALRGDALAVEVRDNGIGIDAEHLPFIFDMFRQVDGSTTRRHSGVGLGLYIVQQFLRRLGGTVEVASTPGRGSRFTVVLPGVVRRLSSVRAA